MFQESSFFENLPSLVFLVAFCFAFIAFFYGVMNLLVAGGNRMKRAKGESIMLFSLYAFLAILIAAFVFLSMMYLLSRGEGLKPREGKQGFPASPIGSFPPPPRFVEIKGYSFFGPFALKDHSVLNIDAVLAILCKKDSKYDIIYLKVIQAGKDFSKDPQYNCWEKNCQGGAGNLFSAFLVTPRKNYSSEEAIGIKNEIETKLNPACLSKANKNNFKQ